ncbi:Esa1p-associated factor [Malassezia sp. CBS 17886]|nr:Esa1p-associated factor [Malassezia sp. CBS 17886]
MLYQANEKVLCFHGPLIYQAKILKAEEWHGDDNQNRASGPHYFVHYQGWKKTWDEWVPQARLLKFTEENLAKQKALVDAQRAEAAYAVSPAAGTADAGAAGRARDKKGAPPVAAPGGRGTKRVRDASELDDAERRPDIRLAIPDVLKLQLVDDWENVTRKEQLVPLPRSPNVRAILDEYAAQHATAQATKPPRSATHEPAVLGEVLAGLKLYFDKSLAQNLLYRFERPQYVALRKRFGPKMGAGDVGTHVAAGAAAPAPRATDEAPATDAPGGRGDLEPSQVYGAEHLLRLFVHLPGIVAHTSMDADSVSILRDHLTEFLGFLAREKERLFARAYEDPSPAYHRVSVI